MTIPYQNIDLPSTEQAAGFPPFTRGYHEYAFVTKTIVSSKNMSFDYTLKSRDSTVIASFFEHIKKDAPKGVISLLLDIPIDYDLISTVRALRTLLALTNHNITNNAAESTFHFYCNSSDSTEILNHFQIAQISQIDTLLVSQNSLFILQNCPINPTPIDSLYGSEALHKNTNDLITVVWNKI